MRSYLLGTSRPAYTKRHTPRRGAPPFRRALRGRARTSIRKNSMRRRPFRRNPGTSCHRTREQPWQRKHIRLRARPATEERQPFAHVGFACASRLRHRDANGKSVARAYLRSRPPPPRTAERAARVAHWALGHQRRILPPFAPVAMKLPTPSMPRGPLDSSPSHRPALRTSPSIESPHESP